jgi:2-keto-4-pentenoate hydratase/2-oxohepta-3-ene-1,7-dioic acid hydratase in catechol pathway
MKLVTFKSRSGGRPTIGCLVDADQAILDIPRTMGSEPAFESMQALIEAGPEHWDRVREASVGSGVRQAHLVRRSDAVLLAPVPMPIQMRDFGCFSEHFYNCTEVRLRQKAASAADPEAAYQAMVQGGRRELPRDYFERPRFYTCNRLSVVGDDTVVPWPRITRQLDFELEFGVFVGIPAKDVSEEQAARHIFGYTIFNDLTMRDVQQAEERTGGKNKDFDCGNVMGPCIVTPDEIGDPYALRAIARVNGEVWCDNNTRTMDRSFEQVISYMSQAQTLHAGEFLASGTVGTGCGLERDRYLNTGDVVELEVERIGTLRTTIGNRSEQ